MCFCVKVQFSLHYAGGFSVCVPEIKIQVSAGHPARGGRPAAGLRERGEGGGKPAHETEQAQTASSRRQHASKEQAACRSKSSNTGRRGEDPGVPGLAIGSVAAARGKRDLHRIL